MRSRCGEVRLFERQSAVIFPCSCGFRCGIYNSNGRANPCRELIFRKLSDYKKVNSGGRYLNNVDLPEGVSDKLEFQSKHKFAIAYENSSHPGYVTEKIVQAFAAKTIPIYWGDPRIKEVFNPKSFICAMDYKSIDDLILKVKEIDCSDNLYIDMINQPALVSQDYTLSGQLNVFDKWIENIFDQDKKDAYRRNMDYFGNDYQDTALDKERMYRNPFIYIKRFLNKTY